MKTLQFMSFCQPPLTFTLCVLTECKVDIFLVFKDLMWNISLKKKDMWHKIIGHYSLQFYVILVLQLSKEKLHFLIVSHQPNTKRKKPSPNSVVVAASFDFFFFFGSLINKVVALLGKQSNKIWERLMNTLRTLDYEIFLKTFYGK